MNIELFTDGSCSAKDRVGGWAFIALDHPTAPLHGRGHEYDTTISRMELKAVIMGLIEVGMRHGPSDVVVHSDSQYVVLGASDKTRKRNLNNDLWDLLDQCEEAHASVEYRHVRGHTGHEHNEKVDQMAGEARKDALTKLNSYRPTRAELVAEYLVKHKGQWILGRDLCTEKIGGEQGLKRLRELRQAGFIIERRKRADSASWEYRFVGVEEDC